MAVHYRTQGFIIKKTDRGESDRLFTIYTKDFGKLDILGKAIRKIKSKLRGGTELFYLSEIEFIQGKTHKTLTDTILIESFPNIRKDLERLKIAHQIAEVLDSLVVKEEKDDQVWQLLKETFDKLGSLKAELPFMEMKVEKRAKTSLTIENRRLEIVYYYFFWHLVSILGYEPEIHDCSIGRKKIDCDVAKILKVILKKDWPILSRLKLESVHLKLLKDVSEWYNKNI